ncbi:MAG: penicillin-binding protein 2 [Candidatus Sungbacteria bacterium]|nr:penicillin-binding protein 2 [Candidatus Sungbacteria bacterium]
MRFTSLFSKSRFSKTPQDLLDPDEILVDSISSLGQREEFEGRIERPIGRLPSIFFLAVIGLGVGYLGIHAASLQISSGHAFFAKSQENRFVTRPIFPPRGVIYDRFGSPLIENIFSFDLVFEKDAFTKARGNLEDLVQNLGSLLGEQKNFFGQADGTIDTLPRRVFIAEDIPLDAAVSVASRESSFPGIQIVESYRRLYHDPFANAHLVGFVGKISEDEVTSRPELQNEETIGKSGVEAFYDSVLRGKGGKKIVEIDSSGKETRFSFTENPEEGSGVRLTIDGPLQQKAYEILTHYTQETTGASVVAINVQTGAVRALVSSPSYDINTFGRALSAAEFQKILKNPLKPLFNRAIAGEFPSGSVIKPIIGAAALQEQLIDPEKKIYDEGFINVPNPYHPGEVSVFKDWRKQGWVNFYDAIAVSANVYFYMVGGGYGDQKGLGVDRIKKYANAFGLGSRLGIDLAGEQPGFIPDPSTKPKTDPQNPIWRIGDTYNMSIGQGGVRVTPLQMAAATTAIANGGKLFRPYLLDAMLDKDGNVMSKKNPELIREGMASADTLHHVVRAMRQTVTSGTAHRLGEVQVAIAAKTGTAQAGSGRPHAWVTAFGPFENPELAVVVMVEHAGEGATVAVPIMRDILAWYFDPGRKAD